MDVRGRDLVTGLPKTIKLSSYEIRKAMKESFTHILEAIRATLRIVQLNLVVISLTAVSF